jgi:mRNA interferase MazF
MHPIHVVHLDKPRPAVLLTREYVVAGLSNVTVAPITSTIRGLSTEVLVDESNGLAQPGAISCDNITTISKTALGRRIGFLLTNQEPKLAEAIRLAFDLD